jgi:perosamine synthetase
MDPPNGQKRGLIVIPNITFIASAFAAVYDRREVELVDVDPRTWNLDLDALEALLQSGEKVDTVMMVHLYGNPCDMERALKLQKLYGFKLIEDACESLGAEINGKKTGLWSDVSCFSFYGNKTFTCGEGGAVITDNDLIAQRAHLLHGQAQDPTKRYWHIDTGYNYRMTNMQAAILCGQLERADDILAEKQRVSDRYHRNLDGVLQFQKVLSGHKHSDWLVTATVDGDRDALAAHLKSNGVDSRKIFYPINEMPPFKNYKEYTVSSWLSDKGISFPSYPTLTNSEIDFVCEKIKEGI